MKGWTEKNLGNTLVRFIDGDRSDRYPSRSEFKDEGVMFLNAESIKNGKINKTSVNFVSQEKYETIRKGRIEKYDVLMTTRGNGIGDVAFVDIPDNGLINAQMLILRANDEMDIFPAYLYYFLKTNYAKEQIGIFSSGSAQPQIPIRDLKHLPILYPLLPIQKKIAAILSAYDDLIENNNRRIAILEKMAEELYREWFVRMRFPGHEKVKIVKGVPEGWAIGRVGDIYNVKSGFAFKSEDLGEIGYPVIKITNIQNGYIDIGSIQRFSGSLVSRILQFEIFDLDLLIAMTGAQVGKTGIFIGTGERFFLNQRVGKFFAKYKNKNNVFMSVFCQTKEFSCQIDNFALGAAQPNISGDQIESIKLLIPTRTLLEDYADKTDPVEKEIVYTKKQNNILTTSRDRLLSRLMSGKIDVENMDIQFPTSMLEESVDA